MRPESRKAEKRSVFSSLFVTFLTKFFVFSPKVKKKHSPSSSLSMADYVKHSLSVLTETKNYRLTPPTPRQAGDFNAVSASSFHSCCVYVCKARAWIPPDNSSAKIA